MARYPALAGAAIVVALVAACGAPKATHPGALTSACAAFGHGKQDASGPEADAAARTPYVENVVTDDHGAPLHRDIAGEHPDGTLTLRRAGSSTNLPVVGGGKCGVAVFEDGGAWVALAPIPADSRYSVVLSGGDSIGYASSALRLSSGQLVSAVTTTDGMPRNPIAYWRTTSGRYAASNGERGHAVDVAGVHVVVYPESHLVSMTTDPRLSLSTIGSLPSVDEVSTTDALGVYLALLPEGVRAVSMQLDPPEGSRTTGQGPVAIVHVSGTSYDVAAVGPVLSTSTGLTMQWTDSRGALQHWSVH